MYLQLSMLQKYIKKLIFVAGIIKWWILQSKSISVSIMVHVFNLFYISYENVYSI